MNGVEMNLKKALSTCCVAAAVTGLLGCAAPLPGGPGGTASGEPGGLPSSYARLAAAGGRVIALDAAASTVRVYVFRGGRAAKVAHNHVLSAPVLSGFVLLSPDGAAAERFDLEFRLDQLRFDDPAQRAALGPAYASVISREAIERTRQNMLGNDNMQAERFPLVRVHSVEIVGEGPRLAAKVQFEMHGQTREFWVPLVVEGLPERLSVSGAVVLRQTDFGVVPFSLLGGLIAVKDEVVVEFKLIGA